jgi:hypothetical protein
LSSPDFDELVDEVSGDERARLLRVHELLLEAGPAAELPLALGEPRERVEERVVPVIPRGYPRRRLAASLVLAAALAAAAFGTGFLIGDRDGSPDSFTAAQAVALSGDQAPNAFALVEIGSPDSAGNRPMILTVSGLKKLPPGGYYTLYMTRDGERKATCGTFNTRGEQRSVFRFTIAYRLGGFDGLEIALWEDGDLPEPTLLAGRLA